MASPPRAQSRFHFNIHRSEATNVYDSSRRRPPALEELVELVRYRDLLIQLIARNLTVRYKRSLLGVAWTLLNPLLMMLVLTAAFSTLFHNSLRNYPVYVLSGLLFWNFFSQNTTSAVSAAVFRSSLLKRIYMPRTIFAVSAVSSGVVNLLLGLLPLCAIMLIFSHPFTPVLLLLPIAILLGAAFALGIALLITSLAIFFTDIIDLYEVLLRALFYLTPIMYPRSIVPTEFAWALDLNPLNNLLELFREPIYQGQLPPLQIILLATLSALLTLALGWWVFSLKADEIAYRI